MSNYTETLKGILAKEAEKKTKNEENYKFTKDELAKKYFSPLVPKGQTSAKFNVRLLPPPEGEFNPFIKVNFHFMQYYGTWNNFLCLKETEGGECPLCETHEALKAKGLNTQKEKDEASRYRPSTWYILKLIERGKESDGVKYWRFKSNYQQNGEFDKIKALIDEDYELLDPTKEGYDLIIDCGLTEKKKNIVKSIMASKKPKPLSDDEDEVLAWTTEDSTWKDIYKGKDFGDLEKVVFGTAPYWDKSQNKLITPTVGNIPEKEEEEIEKVDTKEMIKDDKDEDDSLALDEDDSDLPF